MRNIILATLAMFAVSLFSVSLFADEPPQMLTKDLKQTKAQDRASTMDMESALESESYSNDDYDWRYEIEEALQFLYKNQVDIEERLSKVEKAQIRTSSSSGVTQTRDVPISNGSGDFQLAPGEKLVAIRDAITGQWRNVEQANPTTVSYQRTATPTVVHSVLPTVTQVTQPTVSYPAPIVMRTRPVRTTTFVRPPVQFYSSPTTQVQTTQRVFGGPIMGRIRLRNATCVGGNCF